MLYYFVFKISPKSLKSQDSTCENKILDRDVTRVGETIAYSRLRRDLDDFGRSRLLVLVLQLQLVLVLVLVG